MIYVSRKDIMYNDICTKGWYNVQSELDIRNKWFAIFVKLWHTLAKWFAIANHYYSQLIRIFASYT